MINSFTVVSAATDIIITPTTCLPSCIWTLVFLSFFSLKYFLSVVFTLFIYVIEAWITDMLHYTE
jgi:hypothetical protein